MTLPWLVIAVLVAVALTTITVLLDPVVRAAGARRKKR